jgi:hypothetical protein
MEKLTVLVFKDNQSPRTFQISLGLISRLGLGLSLLAGVTLLSSFLAVKFYRNTLRTSPARVTDLEQEIQDLRAVKKTLEAGSSTAVPAATPKTGPVAQSTAAVEKPLMALFSALPRNTEDLSANSTQLPITVSPANLSWKGKTLNVKFNIEYTSEKKGTQQGRLVILARGDSTLLAYPEGVLNPAGDPALISPDRGEFFSVSRFRETHAELGPVASPQQIQAVEIMIFSSSGQLLTYQKVPVPPTKGAAAAPVPVKSSPAELIKPGVDQ